MFVWQDVETVAHDTSVHKFINWIAFIWIVYLLDDKSLHLLSSWFCELQKEELYTDIMLY